MVDNDKVSLTLPPTEVTQKWLRFYRSIPTGKTFVSTAKEMGVNHNTIRSTLKRYQKRGLLSKAIHIRYRRRKDGDYDIYIVHDAKPATKEKEAE